VEGASRRAGILPTRRHPHVRPPLAGTRMDEPLGHTLVDLDARFDTVRTRESNIGNLFADILRLGLGGELAFYNGGTIRSDQVSASLGGCVGGWVGGGGHPTCRRALSWRVSGRPTTTHSARPAPPRPAPPRPHPPSPSMAPWRPMRTSS
jgi:hypothetical protein